MKKTASAFVLVCAIMFMGHGYSIAQLTLAEWNFPNNPDNAVADLAIPANVAKTLYTVGGTAAVGYGTNTGATTQSAWCTGWDNGNGLKWWETEFVTTGYFNIEVSSKQRSSNTGPKNFVLQYKIGVAGVWTAVPAAPAITVADNFTTGVIANVLLPAACENQPSVYLRWIMSTNTSVVNATVASGGSSRIDDLSIKANDALNHYRSIATGDWATLTTWESSPDLITWSPAQFVPNYYAKTITVRSPHTVSITKAVRIDETTINNGGTVNYNSQLLTINEGSGIDLQVNGSFTDGSATSAAWIAGATWALGANGTYTKTENTNATNWQNNYSGGISTIPATANWYLNKTPSSVTSPSLTTVGMYYPNLTIMNTSGGMWTTSLTSTFTGSLGTATIKGSLDVGGPLAGILGNVDFLTDNTNATPVQVLGNMTIRGSCNVRNNGTGFEIYGNMIANGSASYAGVAARKYKFSGGNAQTISGSSSLTSFQVYQLEVTKTSNTLTLSRPVKVDNNINLVNGIVISSAANLLTVENGATATNASNTSFVRGPVSKLGLQAFTFPVGKNNNYRPIGMGASAASGATFWTETFSNSCASSCLATGYSGPNGAWTVTDASPALDACGFPTSPNTWYVSGAECGNAAGVCGNVCGATDPSLHIGSTTLGDLGASYDAGGWCAFGLGGFGDGTQTDKRVESPVINCTGYSTITLAFNFIENGAGTTDDATLWYYDGTVWAQLANMAKTTICGGQGLWTAYSIALPASANNNANVKIGFKWVNNDDGAGTDPSFAVDDITLTSGAPAEQFTAEYFYTNPQGPYGNIRDLSLDHISQCEYWTLNKISAGASSRTVTLSWDNTSCGVTLLSDLRIARWLTAGTIWKDLGNGSTTGNTTAGTITSTAPDNVFGPYTLGSSSSQNPLPVELLSFDAFYNGKHVELKWVTASEKNNDYFEVERAGQNNFFETLLRVKGAGTSNNVIHYKEYDQHPLSGKSYYRLRQTDFDGTTSLSKTVAVQVNENMSSVDYVYAQPGNGTVIFKTNNAKDANAVVELVNAMGQIIIQEPLILSSEINLLNTAGLSRGVYFLKINLPQTVLTHRFVY